MNPAITETRLSTGMWNTVCDNITYTIRVRNTGDGPATDVRMVDELPNGLRTLSGETRLASTIDLGTRLTFWNSTVRAQAFSVLM